jgi:hypothetical protein
MASSPLASHLIALIISLPLYAVWVVGILVALARWQKHPSVSGLLGGGLAAMLVTSLTLRLGSLWIIESMRQAGQSVSTSSFYLGILGITGSLVRTGAWIAFLVALFGWRLRPGEKAGESPWQFSILGLMGVTLAVAILCGVARWLVVWLGESAAHLIELVDDIPLYVCWLVGLGLAIRRWQRHPAVSRLAVMGIGIHAANTVIWQVVWIALISSHSVGWAPALNAFAVLGAVAGWWLVIAAVLRDREEVVAAALGSN